MHRRGLRGPCGAAAGEEVLSAVCSSSHNPWLAALAFITSRLYRNIRSQLSACREVFLGEQAVNRVPGLCERSKVVHGQAAFPSRQLGIESLEMG